MRRHYRTGEPPPAALLDRLHRSQTLFAGMGMTTQLLYATVDQRLFGPQVIAHLSTASPSAHAVALYLVRLCATVVRTNRLRFYFCAFGRLFCAAVDFASISLSNMRRFVRVQPSKQFFWG